MDDVLDTQCFTKEENISLTLIFKSKFDINVSVVKEGVKFRLYIKADSVMIFNNLVILYMHPDFMYKLKI